MNKKYYRQFIVRQLDSVYVNTSIYYKYIRIIATHLRGGNAFSLSELGISGYANANENINIHIEALTLVAQIAQGGLRDAESLLDQLSLLDGEITVEAVWDLVGSVPEQDLFPIKEQTKENASLRNS
jgi:hypothetical protein